VDVDEQEDKVAGVSGVQADTGDLVVTAGLGNQVLTITKFPSQGLATIR